MVKTGFGNPIIPGTSLKGALRTVIFWHLFNETQKVEEILNNILKKTDYKNNIQLKLDSAERRKIMDSIGKFKRIKKIRFCINFFDKMFYYIRFFQFTSLRLL